MPTLTQRMDALESALTKLVGTLEKREAAPRPRGKSRTKRAKDTRTMAERREQGAGGVCPKHDRRFATASGFEYHASWCDLGEDDTEEA